VIIVVIVPVLALLAALLLVGAMRRNDTGEAIGSLSRETVKRDRVASGAKAAVGADEAVEDGPSGRDIERSAAIERRQAGALATTGSSAPAVWTPPDPESIGVSRRQFLNRSVLGVSGFGLSAFGVAIVGFLWPSSSGGFGSKIRVGNFNDIQQKIDDGGGFAYYPEGRMWITNYPASAIDKAETVYSPPELAGMEAGFVALYQKCVHLGCRVPQCVTSQWFECPCHGSQYNQVGEKKGGPAPRGLDRFAMTVAGDSFTVDTGLIIQGPPIGVNTTGQEAEGPHCVSGGAGH